MMRNFSEIPDRNHVAPRVRNDLCEPIWKRGDVLMADTRLQGSAGSHVWAKAFGECPQVMPFDAAIRQGMKILGDIVGAYQLNLGEAA
jgi:hypothetical protein